MKDWRFEAEDWFLLLLWGAEKLMVPTWHNLFEPYEAWERRHQFGRQVNRLEQRKLLKREERAGTIVYRLTELGRLSALGGRDPVARWKHLWDGQWRMVLFDLPVGRQTARVRLLRWLRANGFGYLQKSVWIHPDPVTDLTDALRDFRDDVESFTIMESHCCVGYSNAAIVQGAWDFAKINRRYQAYLPVATSELRQLCTRNTTPAAVGAWLRRERVAWAHALALDPLLPRVLLPSDYLGQHAWEARQTAMSTLAARLRR